MRPTPRTVPVVWLERKQPWERHAVEWFLPSILFKEADWWHQANGECMAHVVPRVVRGNLPYAISLHWTTTLLIPSQYRRQPVPSINSWITSFRDDLSSTSINPWFCLLDYKYWAPLPNSVRLLSITDLLFPLYRTFRTARVRAARTRRSLTFPPMRRRGSLQNGLRSTTSILFLQCWK